MARNLLLSNCCGQDSSTCMLRDMIADCDLNLLCLAQSFTVILLLLKGLGHAILGNFSTDRMVIELPKISK